MRRVIATIMMLAGFFAVPAASQPIPQEEARNLQLQIDTRDLLLLTVDLVFKVESIGGQVQSLQVKQAGLETRIELPADILFDFDKYDLRPTAETALRQAAELIQKGARGTVRIEGHTDSKGSAAYNQTLSQRRAAAVQRWFMERGELRQTRFAIQAYGAQKPVAPNAKPDGSDDAEGRQKNRRVEIVFGRR